MKISIESNIISNNNNNKHFNFWIFGLIKYKMDKLIKISSAIPYEACDNDVCQKYSQTERQRKEENRSAEYK